MAKIMSGIDEYIKKKKEEEERAEKFALDFSDANIEQATREFNTKKVNKDKYTSEGKAGYEFGDFSKTLGGTIADFGLNIGKGFFQTGEAITDTLQVLSGDISEFFLGENDFSKFMKGAASQDVTGAVFGTNNKLGIEGWTDAVNDYSMSNDFTDSVAEGIGQMFGFMGASGLGGLAGLTSKGAQVAVSAGAAWSSGFGNTYTELRRQGVDDATAHKKAVISGAVEALSEQFFNKIPGVTSAGWGDALAGRITDATTDFFKNKAVGRVVSTILDGLAEGSEEIISNMFDQVGNDLLYIFDSSYSLGQEDSLIRDGYQFGDITRDFLKQMTTKESLTAFLSASVSSFIMNGGKGVINKNIQNKVLTAYAKDNGITFDQAKQVLSEQLESAKKEVIADKTEYNSKLELEDIATDRIINYMRQYTGQNIETGIDNIIADIQKNKGIQYTEEQKNDAKKQLRALYEDQLNSPQRYRSFTLKNEPKTESQKNLARSMDEAGLTDTDLNHQIYDFVSRLLEGNPNSKIEFANKQKLAQLGLYQTQTDKNGNVKYGFKINKDGKTSFEERTIQGVKYGDTIYIDSDLVNTKDANGNYKFATDKDAYRAYTKIIGHELGEAILSSDKAAYDELKQLVKEINNFKETDLDMYKSIYGDNLSEDVENEYINDKLGELFENDAMIEKISGHQNILQKLITELKRIVKYMTSSKEKKKIIQLQNKLMQKYAELYKETKFEGAQDAKYALGKHYGDLGKGNDTYYFQMANSRRSTGHFGTGTYFVNENYQPGKSSTYANRPTQSVEFDDYNLFKPQSANDGFDLHDALKEVNYNNTPISQELYNKLLPYYEDSFKSYNATLDEDYDNNYENVRELLKEAGVETESQQEYYESGKGQYGNSYEKYLEEKITDVLNNNDRYEAAKRDLQRVLGISDEQFEKSIQEVRNAEQKYESMSTDEQLKADSLSTIFMKSLGYNGVDVRGLDQLDNTTYGSVIYDLDNKVDNTIKMKYNSIEEAVEADLRKEKYTKYSDSIEFFNLEYEDMEKVSKFGSQFANEIKQLGLDNGSFDLDISGKPYSIYLDLINQYNENNEYSITDVIPIDDDVRSDIDERLTKQNNGLLVGDGEYNEEYNNSNIESIENRRTSKENVNLPTAKQRQQGIDESRQNNQKELTNSKELESSFNLPQYSLSQDSQGRELSQEQQEYFKDSKVRDSEGKLIPMYHGTPTGTTTEFRPGTYFTSNKEYADTYQNPGASSISSADRKVIDNPKTYQVYLDIKNPFDISNPEIRDIFINEYVKGGYALGINPYLSDAEYDKIQTIDWTEGENLQEFLEEEHPEFDGLVLDEGGIPLGNGEVLSRGTSYVVMSPEQVKNIDNTNPTSNPDIRYSLSEDNQGRTLSQGQQNFVKGNAKELYDSNGKIKTYYHTTTNEVKPFAVFNPVGTPGYKYGDVVVNFYTDNPTMSGSYADSDYVKYSPEATEKAKYQYEGYISMKNPYVVDSEERSYGRANIKANESATKVINVLNNLSDDTIKELAAIKQEASDQARQNERVVNQLEYLRKGMDKEQQVALQIGEILDATEKYNLNEEAQERNNRLIQRILEREGFSDYDLDNLKYEYYTNIFADDLSNFGIEQKNLTLKDFAEIEKEAQSKNLFTYEIFDELIKDHTNNEQIKQILDTTFDVKQQTRVLDEETGTKQYGKLSDLVYDAIEFDGTLNRKYLTKEGLQEHYVVDGLINQNTNDVIREVLEMNKNGANYDGVVFKNLYDYGGATYDLDSTAGDVVVTFNSNQFKDFRNENPTSNPDIRYSLSPSNEMIDNTTGEKVTFDAQEVQTQLPIDKTLMAIHNLNADKLNGVLDLGGFPYPSIAITKPGSISHEGYGDISVIFNEDTINPEINSKNKVYSRDAYTPRFPTLEYKVSSNEAKNIRKVIGDYDYRNPLPGDKYISDAYSIMDNLEDNINRSGLERTLDDIKNSDAMKYVYLKNTNQPFEVETKAENYSSQYDNSTLQRFLDNYNGEFDYNNVSSADIDNYLDNMLEAYRQQMLDKYTSSGMDEKAINVLIERNLERFSQNFAAKDNFLRAAYQLQKYGLDNQVLDTEATKAKLNDVINQEEYNKWVDNLFSNIIEKKGLRNNKDYYTASGTPRSFEQLHDEYTLDNVVKILDALNDTGEESGFFTGISEIAGNASIRFNTMQDIKANENLLETIGSEDYSQMLDNIGDRLSTIQESIMERGNHNSDNYFIARDNMSSAIADAARIFGEGKKIDAKKVQKMLKDYGFEATIEESQQILDMFKEMRGLPTQYFEAKPKRAVGFDEIGAVVIPSNVSEDLKQRLTDNNIQYTEYNPEIEGDRQAKINEYQQYMFSLGLQSDESLPYLLDKKIETPEEYQNALNKYNLPTSTETSVDLPFYEADENLPKTIEERMSEVRKQLADSRFSKMMEKQTFKSIKESTKMAKSYLDFDTQQTEQFKKQISKLAKLPKDNLIKAKNYNQLKDIVTQYANKDINFVNEELKAAQKDVRNTELVVSQELKNQITDWSDFRKSSGLKIKTGLKSNVDVVYQELLDSYPGMFDATITNYADQLQELKEFVKRDNKYVQHFELSDDSINQITNKIWEKLSSNALTIQEITDIQNDITAKLENRTREVVRQDLLNTMGLTEQDIAQGKDITSIAYQRTDPNRLNEKVFGLEVGRKINEATAGFVKHQEANKIRFLNQERSEIKDLGIKARSKESAAVQKFGEKQYVNDKGELVQYTEQDLRNEFKDEATIQRIKNAADVLRQKYDRYIDMINSSLVEMGYDPIPKRQDYFKHFMELEDKLSQFGWTFSKENIMKEELPTDVNGLTADFKPGKNYFASALQRKGLKTTYDAITGIDTYLEGASNLIYHTESIQRYRALSKLIRDTYGQQHGLENIELMTPEEAQQRVQDVYDNKLTRYAAWLDEQANSLAGKKAQIDRSVERIVGRKGYTFLNALKKQVGSNMTGFNVRSALTNFASAIQGASKTEKLSALQGFAFALKNYRNLDPLVAKSDFLATRFGSDSLSKKTWQKISEAGQVFMNASDRFTSLQIWGGKYYEGLHNGLTEQAAIQQADNFAARIMGDRSKGQTAEIFNSKTLGFLTQFQLEVNNQWSSMIHDSKMAYKENPGLKAGLHIANQLGQLYVASWVFNNLMKALTGSDVMFDPIDLLMGLFNPDDEDESLEDRATDMIGKIVNQLPMASIFTGGRIPISEAFKGLETGFKYATHQTDQYGNNFTLEDVKNDFIGSFAYYLLPTGYGQIKKTTQGLGMYTHELPGSYTNSGRLRFEADTSPLGMLQAGLFGQYASGEAREYFDKGLQPLTEKKIEEAKEINLPIKEYRKIDEGISKAKQEAKERGDSQTEAEYDYIYNLPLDMDTRNKLLNSRLNTSDNVTDDNGYVKYTDGSKTYWYDEENDIVYNSKYRKMDNIKVSQLEKYSNVKDISDYSKYGSLDEFNYANNNPEKYLASQQIASYDTYIRYKDDIAAIKDNYNDGTTAGKNKAKDEVYKYINALKLNKNQKLMLMKMAGGYSIKNYKTEIYNYINGLNLSKKEKEQVYGELF